MDYSTALLASSVCIVLGLCKLATRKSSTVADIPGPESHSWVYGNMLQLVFPSIYGEFEFKWLKTFGPAYKFKGVFGEDRLMLSDPAAVQHVLNNHSFIRSPPQWQAGKLVFGAGSVYCAEADGHKRLRAALAPGFSTSVVRKFTPIFAEIAQRIVLEWEKACSSEQPTRLNICEVIDRATLDIISEAALGLPLNTVAHPEHALAQSHLNVIAAAFNRSKSDLLAEVVTPHIPSVVLHSLLRLPTAAFSALRNFRRVTDQLSSTLMKEKVSDDESDMLGIFVKGLSSARNKNTTPEEVAEQMRVILLGGQDTSADALAWALHELSKDQAYQTKLRTEITGASRPIDYDSLPLLNALLKEVLRLYPAAPFLERIASTDGSIPLSQPITTTRGERIDRIPVRKGQYVALGVASYQRYEPIWGADAHEFKPERWLGDQVPCNGQALGPYAHLLTFSGGFRSCIGWRFSLLEMQVILCEVISNFVFSPSPKLEEDAVKPLYAGVLVPITKEGVKGLRLGVQRVTSES
ncbi:PAH-inducible cytochrome P450 monooxygenase [Mycena kentingensis (nom. inval.)]|nr:PAH-inducible cytochrome P450 monooxygenase [Mycena kentingensis (nom. inval.)]